MKSCAAMRPCATTFAAVEGGRPRSMLGEPELPLVMLDHLRTAEHRRQAEAGASRSKRPDALRPVRRSTGAREGAKLDERRARVLLTMHHIVTDGWSIGIAARRARGALRGIPRGEPSPLPELPHPIRRLCPWQRGGCRGKCWMSWSAYWKAGWKAWRRSGCRATGRVRRSERRRGDVMLLLGRELSEALRPSAARKPRFHDLLAAFQACYTGTAGRTTSRSASHREPQPAPRSRT